MSRPDPQPSAPMHLRVFLGSPGDVADERVLARKVISQLPSDPFILGQATLEEVSWDKPGARTAMLATLSPQDAIARGLPKPSECDIVVIILWSRIGTPLDDTHRKPDGSRYFSGTEWEFEEAIQAADREGKPHVLVYRCVKPRNIKDSDPGAFDKLEQSRLVQKFFDGFKNADGSIRRSHTTYRTSDEFREDLEFNLRQLIKGMLESKGPGSVVPFLPLWEGSPFPGLHTFDLADAPIFFGRGPETDELVQRLADPANRFICVVGASGSGKSSLVAAGLQSRARDGAIEGSQEWIWLRFSPGEFSDDPFQALAHALSPLLKKSGLVARDVVAKLSADAGAFAELAPLVLKGQPDWAELVLFIDQFEELFTQVSPAHRDRFIKLLEATAQQKRVRIVATLRADFYAQCVESPEMAVLLRPGSYPLAAPGFHAMMQMITRPAELAGLVFEDRLAERILEDTGKEPGALPLMAFALSQLYETRDPDNHLTHAAYDGFGGVQGAIARQAEETFGKLDREVQDTLSLVFRELVSVDDRGIATRQRARVSRVAATAAAAKLVEKFTEARLLVQSRGPGDEPIVEVAHEALFANWPRLADWIREIDEDLRLLRHVRIQAAEWERKGRPEEFLWPEKGLPTVYGMIGRLEPELAEPERRFLSMIDSPTLLDELEEPLTTHARRDYIGNRLARDGDKRPGVGVRKEDGLPDIAWCKVPGGEVVLEGVDGVFRVEPFLIAKYPITWIQYRTFVEAADGYHRANWWRELAHRDENPGTQYWRLDNHPAEDICWYDAVAFCRWLSSKLGYEVRLPTEWQWQQAATGGEPLNEYPWGAEWNPRFANTEENGLGHSTAVGMYPPGASSVGALDMMGNIWEWCVNEFEIPARVDLSGDNIRAVRGGAATFNRESARAGQRERDRPELRSRNRGLRLARS